MIKAIAAFFASLGILGILVGIAIGIATLAFTIYGLVLAFSASIILGIITLIVEPCPLVIGLVAYFFHVNLANIVMQWLQAHQ